MAIATLRDLWAADWEIHEDPKGILKGIKDLKFTLKLAGSVGNFDVYDIDYTAEDPNEDPFVDTQFLRFGKEFPVPPDGKLKPWNPNEENHYRKLIDDTFTLAPANFNRLIGEKEVNGKKEFLMLLLIPEAIDTETGNPQIIDLIYAVCNTHSGFAPNTMLQDGTAHGNPK